MLPNSIAVGPRFFVQMTKTIPRFLCEQGVQIVIYIDDTLVIAHDKSKALEDHDRVIDTFQKCGFTINFQEIQFRTFHCDRISRFCS